MLPYGCGFQDMNSTDAGNFLTVDLEEWFHVNYPGIDSAALASSRSNLPELTERLLAVFGSLECGVPSSF